jgi:hypothetical protein
LIRPWGSVATGGDTAPVFEAAENDLDAVAALVVFDGVFRFVETKEFAADSSISTAIGGVRRSQERQIQG